MSKRPWLIFCVVVLVCLIIAIFMSPESNSGFASSAALLTFVGIVAVAIERLIELVWTLTGNAKGLGGWWPFNLLKDEMERLEAETNKLLEPIFNEATEALTRAKAQLNDGDELAKRITNELANLASQKSRLEAHLANAERLAPGSARLALGARVSRNAAVVLSDAATLGGEATKQVREKIEVAYEGTEMALDIVASFEDNPARRIASLMLGASVGLLIAGFMGLNIFAAVLGADPAGGATASGTDLAGLLAGIPGIVLTGILLGFGASPTHEVIKALQNYKEARKGDESVPLAGQTVRETRYQFGLADDFIAVDHDGSALPRTTRIRSTQ